LVNIVEIELQCTKRITKNKNKGTMI